MPDDLFKVIVINDEGRVKEVAAAGEAAEEVDVGKILRTSASSEEAADRIALAAIALRESRRPQLVKTVREHVNSQADALKRSDPTKIPAITEQSVAEMRAKELK